jgi:tetratricopeptide (TPR) repeat protein
MNPDQRRTIATRCLWLGGVVAWLVAGGCAPTPAPPREQASAREAREARNQGVQEFRAGRISEAIADFDRALRLLPADPASLVDRGRALLESGNPAEAIDDLTRAMQAAPRSVLAYNLRGQAYEKNEQLDRAVADYSEAIRQSPQYSEALVNRARLERQLGFGDRALDDLNAALPAFKSLFVPTAQICFQSGRPCTWRLAISSVPLPTTPRSCNLIRKIPSVTDCAARPSLSTGTSTPRGPISTRCCD